LLGLSDAPWPSVSADPHAADAVHDDRARDVRSETLGIAKLEQLDGARPAGCNNHVGVAEWHSRRGDHAQP